MANGGLGTGGGAIIGDAVEILVECAERGLNFGSQPLKSIGVVPSYLRDVSPSCFQPRVVSIGPLHRQDKDVKGFERHKEFYLARLLTRTGNSSLTQSLNAGSMTQTMNAESSIQTLNACVQKVNGLMDQIRATYAEEISYSDAELAKMMVMDACFIIEFLEDLENAKSPPSGDLEVDKTSHSRDLEVDKSSHSIRDLEVDKTLSSIKDLEASKSSRSGDLEVDKSSLSQNLMYIAMDMVLLENQIPFFVLQDIYECTSTTPTTSLANRLLRVLSHYINPFVKKLENVDVGEEDREYSHILGLLHNLFKSDHATPEIGKNLPTYYSATELNRAGVTFMPYNKMVNCWPMAMQYEPSNYNLPCWKPVLRMPALHIDDQTEQILRNFIAYEQSSKKVHEYFTSYTIAMDTLIDTTEDVCKLVESEVIVNYLGSNADATKMINNICKEVSFSEFFYCQQWEDLDKYYKCYWPKSIAWLRRRYFSNPWSVVALFAGIAVFVLTVIQTVFSIKS